MKILAIDFGESRVGIAISDKEATVAFPKTVFNRKSDEQVIDELQKLCIDESVDEIVVGLPLDQDDNETDRSRRTRSFAEKLKQTLPYPLHFQDEAYSTKEGIELMPKMKQKSDRDLIAAQRILERYLTN